MKNNRFKNRMQGQSRHSFKGANFTQNINPSTNLDSNGPCGHIKGNVCQVMEKYLNAAKDAQANNDNILAEICLQHADHYYRIYTIALENENLRFHNHNAETISEDNTFGESANEKDSSDNSDVSLADTADDRNTMIDSSIAFLGKPVIPETCEKNLPASDLDNSIRPKRQYRRRAITKDNPSNTKDDVSETSVI